MSVTIRDVAKTAGVSAATVSKVLNGSHTISESTAQRVRNVMKALDYQPNARARSFARKATKNILFLIDLPINAAYEHPHMFEILAGSAAMLNSRGYTLMVKPITLEDTPAFVTAAASQKLADGLLLHASVFGKKTAKSIERTNIAHLVIGQPNIPCNICWMDTDNKLSGVIAARHLMERGYRRIAMIGGKPEDMVSWHRLQGARSAFAEAGSPVESALVKQGDSTPKWGSRLTRQLLRAVPKPDAILCANNIIAMGCLQALRDAALTIPKDVAVMTFDSYPFSTITDPALTVVDINMFDMGGQAARFILDKIKKPNLQAQVYTTLPELVVREST